MASQSGGINGKQLLLLHSCTGD